MLDQFQHNVGFLAHIGVAAEIGFGADGSPLIVIETSQYDRKRSVVDNWYTLVEQNNGHSYFCERLRGTGTTT